MKTCKFGLEFPEATFLSDGRSLYFWVEGEGTAYAMPNGETKELEGKHVYTARAVDQGQQNFKIAHELEDGQLIAARLTTEFGRSAGQLMSEEKIAQVNDMLEAGTLEVYRKPSPSRICYAGQLMNQQFVVWVDDYSKGNGLDRSLYMGMDRHNLEKVEYETYMQGGNSFGIKISDDEFLDIDPYNSNGAPLSLGDIKGVLLEVEDRSDFAVWGISLPEAKPHYDLFTHPKSKMPKPSA